MMIPRELFWDLGKLRGIDSSHLDEGKERSLGSGCFGNGDVSLQKKNPDNKIKSCLETQK